MRNTRLAALLVLGALSLSPPVGGEDPARPVREFNLFVKEWTWDPRTLRVKKGSHVVLNIESMDGARAFLLKPYRIKVPLPEGERVRVEFDADREGTFEFQCGRPCGNGCAKLRGQLIVSP